MPDNVQNSNININQSLPLVHSYGFGKTVNVNNDNTQNVLIKNYKHIVFDSSTRTIWYEGVPYGVSYQFNNSNSYNNTVLGDSLTHGVSGVNNIISGSYNQMSSVINGGIALGSYNKCDNTNTYSYIFTIGNGEDEKHRSNLMAIHQANDSTDRTTTSLTGYLNVDYLESNISYSYVSSLGKSATADIILSALLEPAPYHLPYNIQIKYLTYGSQTIELGNKFKNPTIGLVWSSPGGLSYDYNYIETYINKYSKLPNGITLDDLGYTKGILDDAGILCLDYTDNHTASPLTFSIPGCYMNFKTATTNGLNFPTPSTVKPCTFQLNTNQIIDKTKLTKLKYPSFTSQSSQNIFDISNLYFKVPGTVTFSNYNISEKVTKTFAFAEQQNNYFKQLYDKGIMVVSDSNKTHNILVKVNLPNPTLKIGVPYLYGLVNDTNSGNLTKDEFQKLIGDTAETANLKKSSVIYTNSSKDETIYFGANKLGNKDGNVVFIGFPTFANIDSDKQRWQTRAKTSQDWSYIPNSGGVFNYVFTHIIKINENFTTNYIFYVCKQSAGSFKEALGAESEAGTGLRITVKFNINGISLK